MISPHVFAVLSFAAKKEGLGVFAPGRAFDLLGPGAPTGLDLFVEFCRADYWAQKSVDAPNLYQAIQRQHLLK